MDDVVVENNLRAERIAAGFDAVEELAERAGIDPTWCSYIEDGRVLPTAEEYRRLLDALGGIPSHRLYTQTWRQLTGIDESLDTEPDLSRDAEMWRGWRDESHLLMSRDEINYYDREPGPDHHVDVYVNLSCGTQRSPHLLMDTVSVLEALGVSFVAAAGPGAGCCGKPLFLRGPEGMYDRHRERRIRRSVGWSAGIHVNWCGACQQVTTAHASLHELAGGAVHPVREVQLLEFLEERVRELGDRVPWRKEVHRLVLAEGEVGRGNVHRDSLYAIPKLLAMVPGVEPVGLYDGWSHDSPCAAFGREGSPAPDWTQRPETPEEFEDHRIRLTEEIHALGADTVSCQHQTCHQMWSRYAGDDLAVVHAVSILAEALDCAHPDRFQDAVRHGDPHRVVEESRPRWESWGMTEQRAAEAAASLCDFGASTKYLRNPADAEHDRFGNGSSGCGGCGGACRRSASATR